MSGKNNGKKISLPELYREIADVIIKHGRKDKPLTFPLTIGGQTVDEKTAVEAVITHWKEIAHGLGVHVYADPIAIETEEDEGVWIVKVHLPYLYSVEIVIGNGGTPYAWIETPKEKIRCLQE